MEKEAALVTAKEKQLAREDSQLRSLMLKDITIKGVHVLVFLFLERGQIAYEI